MKIDMRRYASLQPAEQAARMLEELKPAVDKIHVMRNRVLVATYQEPEKTAGGIYLADKTLDEGKWQGKVGLLLKLGPIAFQFDEILEDCETTEHEGVNAVMLAHNIPHPGDWVFFRGSDTWDCGIKIEGAGVGVHCRFLNDDSIVGRVTDPSVIW
jgi:hypothetical protein